MASEVALWRALLKSHAASQIQEPVLLLHARKRGCTQASVMQAEEQKVLAFSWIWEFDGGRTVEDTSILTLEEMCLRQHVMSSIILIGTPWDGKIFLKSMFGKSLQAKSYCKQRERVTKGKIVR